MNEPNLDQKSQIEIISKFRDRAWDSFDERRRHEYHMSLLFWAIYIGVIGYVLKSGLSPEMKWPLITGVILFAGVYLFWNYNLSRTQHLDRTIAIHFGDKLLDACMMKEEFYNKFDFRREHRIKDSAYHKLPLYKAFWEYLKNWNHLSELLLTLLLTAAAIAVIAYAKLPTPPASP